MEYGHRRDVEGYARCIENFDKQLGELIDSLKHDDLLILTADHGNDPTFRGSDHTREAIPVIAYSPKLKNTGLIESLDTFGSIGATVADNFNLNYQEFDLLGTSFLDKL